jgi:hypothetical protein
LLRIEQVDKIKIFKIGWALVAHAYSGRHRSVGIQFEVSPGK